MNKAEIMRLARECAHKKATPANWYALEAAVDALEAAVSTDSEPVAEITRPEGELTVKWLMPTFALMNGTLLYAAPVSPPAVQQEPETAWDEELSIGHTPLEVCGFLSERFKHAGVSDLVALRYAKAIDMMLAAQPAEPTALGVTGQEKP